MKTLKKTLCLVLAMVMVFGLCAISASAKLGYGDTDDITYKEAVDVMSGIGILSGDERGFRPTANITRAEAAKIIAYIMIGNAGQAEALKATSAPFADVPASHWAAGYIAYCASSGVILGMGDGYHPNENVTGLQFATMLLRALGYGKNSEYVGSDWSINAARDALRLGIFYKNVAGATEEPATREECALYAFNVINGANSDYTGIKKVTYSALLGDYVSTGSLVGDATDANKGKTFGDDFNLAMRYKNDNPFQLEDGHYWIINDAKKTVISGDYDNDENLQKVFTTKVTGGDIYDLLGSDAKKLTNTSLIYVNADGKEVKEGDEGAIEKYKFGTLEVYVDGEIDTALDPSKFVKGNEDTILKTGNGVETYVYSWYNDGVLNAKICVVNTYMVKVQTVTKATAKKDPSTTVNALGQATSEGPLSGVTLTYNTDEFAKDDYVLITAAGGKIRSMEPVTVIEDEISRYNQDGTKKSIVVNGTTYSPAFNVAKDSDVSTMKFGTDIARTLVDGKDHKVYVDKYGYIIAVDDVSPDTNYVYVAQMGVKLDDSGKIGSGYVLKADIYYADGTNEIVTVSTDPKDAPKDVTNAFKDLDKTLTPTSIDNDKCIGIYKLNWKGDKAVLSSKGADVSAGTANVSKGISKANDSNKFDNKTVFFYVNGTYDDDLTVTTYTGINSVPTAKKVDDKNEADLVGVILGTAKEATTVKAAQVNSSFAGEGDTVYFYVGTGAEGTYDKVGTTQIIYYVYAAGEQETTELELTYKDTEVEAAIDAATDAGFYKVGSGNKLSPVKDKKEGKLNYVAPTNATADSTTLIVKETGYGFVDCNIVDLRGKDTKITDTSALVDAIGSVSVAFAYNENNIITDLYVLDAIPASEEPAT